ncbi:MAG: hypothetical protein WBA10_15800, partial [Elainellaceae cyanobacterium]
DAGAVYTTPDDTVQDTNSEPESNRGGPSRVLFTLVLLLLAGIVGGLLGYAVWSYLTGTSPLEEFSPQEQQIPAEPSEEDGLEEEAPEEEPAAEQPLPPTAPAPDTQEPDTQPPENQLQTPNTPETAAPDPQPVEPVQPATPPDASPDNVVN